MQEQDYLMKQVKQLGLILEKIFSKLLNLKDDRIKSTIDVNQIFIEEFGFDLMQITINDNEWIHILKHELSFDNVNLEKLADILLLMIEYNITDENNYLHQKCLKIYQYLEKTERTYSLHRNLKINKLMNYKNNDNN